MPPPPSIEERWQTIIDYTRQIMARPFREQRHTDLRWMRPKFIALTKGIKGSRKIRGALTTVVQIEDLERIAQEHIDQYASTRPRNNMLRLARNSDATGC